MAASPNRSRSPTCRTRLADLAATADALAVARLIDHYAEHPLGNNGPLPETIRARVMEGLRQHPTTRVMLAEVESQPLPVGMAICFLGFSTFQAKTLINIHDLVVDQTHRGMGVGSALIDAVMALARNQDWCAVTLEVRADNPARELYQRKGFQGLDLTADERTTLFGKVLLQHNYGSPNESTV